MDTQSPHTDSDIRVYRSLGQVLKVLTSPEVIKFPHVKQALQLADIQNVITKTEDGTTFIPQGENANQINIRDPDKPLIVIEGLDGSGKTTMTKFLENNFKMELCMTPPKSLTGIPDLRNFFDSQPEKIKRAFYSLGNYMAAQYVRSTDRPIVMDRFWHSTAAYAYANNIKSGGNAEKYSAADLVWPSDLFQPNLVIFLQLSEENRLKRHASREAFTNTKEERELAADREFRENIEKALKSIQGVPLVELNVDGSPQDCEKAIAECVLEKFPAFKVEPGLKKGLDFGSQ